jgi:hypothetical protein
LRFCFSKNVKGQWNKQDLRRKTKLRILTHQWIQLIIQEKKRLHQINRDQNNEKKSRELKEALR